MNRAIAEVVGLSIGTLYLFMMALLAPERLGPLRLFLGAVMLLVIGIAAYRRVRWDGQYLIVGTRALRVMRRGRTLREIPFEEIAGYRLHEGDTPTWLTVTLRNGEIGLEIPRSAFSFSQRPAATRAFVREIGPRLPADATQARGDRPEDRLGAYLFDHYGNPPPVAMTPGVRYRYMEPEKLKSAYQVPLGCFGLLPLAAQMPNMFMNILMRKHPGRAFAAMFAVYGLLLLAILWRTVPLFRLACNVRDRFEMTPDGIRVFHKGRSFLLGQPVPGRNLRTASGIVPAYRNGKRIYYFDPRFLEEDA